MSGVFTKHINAFWMLFLVDLRETMKSDDNILLKLRLFHTVNQYFCSQREFSLSVYLQYIYPSIYLSPTHTLTLSHTHTLATMKLGEFHRAFLDNFTPVVIQYMEGLETSMREDLARSFSQEEWMPVRCVCVCSTLQTHTLSLPAVSVVMQSDWL